MLGTTLTTLSRLFGRPLLFRFLYRFVDQLADFLRIFVLHFLMHFIEHLTDFRLPLLDHHFRTNNHLGSLDLKIDNVAFLEIEGFSHFLGKRDLTATQNSGVPRGTAITK